jgi:hypothetical protein
MKSSLFSWLLRIVVAAILVQTLYFKFTGAAESIYIFKTLGMEPYGRIGSGIIELVSSILILIPRTTLLGALLVLSYDWCYCVSRFVLGIAKRWRDTFMLALITFLCCSILVYQNRNKMTDLLKLKI